MFEFFILFDLKFSELRYESDFFLSFNRKWTFTDRDRDVNYKKTIIDMNLLFDLILFTTHSNYYKHEKYYQICGDVCESHLKMCKDDGINY